MQWLNLLLARALAHLLGGLQGFLGLDRKFVGSNHERDTLTFCWRGKESAGEGQRFLYLAQHNNKICVRYCQVPVNLITKINILQYSEYKTFKVVRLWHSEKDRMILSLGSAFHHSYRLTGVVGSLGDDLQEQGLIKVVGTRASDEVTARLQ